MDSLTTRQAKRRGFNLIESAIVLGVVGLVVGGIWSAASAVLERQKINDLVGGVILGADKLRNLVTPAAIEASPNNGGSPPYYYLHEICINANIFPSFLIENGKIQNPFGSQIRGYANYENGSGIHCAARNNQIIINFPVPTNGICQKIIAGISSKYRGNSELAKIWLCQDQTNPGCRTVTSYPVSPSGTQCDGLIEPIQIRLFFTLKRFN